MPKNPPGDSSVTMGDVSGGIHGSVIAGGDVSNVASSAVPTYNKQASSPSIDEMNGLLQSVKLQLAELASHREALTSISPAAPHSVQAAHDCIEAVQAKVRPDASPQDRTSVAREVAEAKSSLVHLLDNANGALKGASQVAESAKPVIERIAPLINSLSTIGSLIAAIWR